MYKFLLSIILLITTSACASFVKGRSQNILIDTQQVRDATCKIVNDKSTWDINKTPKVVTISDSYHNVEVTCVKSGYKKGRRVEASSTRGWLFGNMLFGPLFPVGMAVDILNGAAYQYPDHISVAMEAYPAPEEPKKVEVPLAPTPAPAAATPPEKTSAVVPSPAAKKDTQAPVKTDGGEKGASK